MRCRRGARRALVIAAVTVVLLAAGVIGYWTAPGAGTAATTLGTPEQLTLSAGTPSTEVAPGRAAAVAAVATNPNPHEVRIESLSLDTARGSGGFAVDAGHSGCGLAALGFARQDNGGAGWTVPPKVGSTPGSLTISLGGALTMSADAADSCQGATFTVYLQADL